MRRAVHFFLRILTEFFKTKRFLVQVEKKTKTKEKFRLYSFKKIYLSSEDESEKFIDYSKLRMKLISFLIVVIIGKSEVVLLKQN